MEFWVALFRGINVGGRNRLPMKSLVAIFDQLGCTNVKTFIQSGNAVFQSPSLTEQALERKIQAAVNQKHGFEPAIMLFPAELFVAAAVANPFPDAELEPKTLHLFFLGAQVTAVDDEKIEELKNATERYQIVDNVFYLHAPDGIGRSKLAAGVERCLGVPVTARNWRTVTKITEYIQK